MILVSDPFKTIRDPKVENLCTNDPTNVEREREGDVSSALNYHRNASSPHPRLTISHVSRSVGLCGVCRKTEENKYNNRHNK